MRAAGLLALGILGLGASPVIAASQPCDCTSWDDEPGVVWTGCSPLVLPQIAELVAPALWYTRDEPLLLGDDPARIPTNHPFGGVRLGVQALGFGSLDDIRLIFEIGAGAW